MKIPHIKEYNQIPVVTSTKMKHIDRIATMEYSISGEVLMENAGKKSAEEIVNYVKEKLNKDIKDVVISVLCGRGNNGGDGLVCARYLKDSGGNVKIFIVSPSDKGYTELVVKNLEKARERQIPIKLCGFDNLLEVEKEIKDSDIIVDGLLGISAVGKPVGVVKRLIQIANKSKRDIIALDIPSGINPDSGHHTGVFITAKMTLTFGFVKSGLMAGCALKNIGILKVIDIGYPQELINRVKENRI